jgi:hypothetical protein
MPTCSLCCCDIEDAKFHKCVGCGMERLCAFCIQPDEHYCSATLVPEEPK